MRQAEIQIQTQGDMLSRKEKGFSPLFCRKEKIQKRAHELIFRAFIR